MKVHLELYPGSRMMFCGILRVRQPLGERRKTNTPHLATCKSCLRAWKVRMEVA